MRGRDSDERTLVHPIPQLSKSASKQQGVPFGRDFALKFNQKPYFNAGIFFDDIRTIFLPYIDTVRGLAVLAPEIAV
jgi:hypothetical protein